MGFQDKRTQVIAALGGVTVGGVVGVLVLETVGQVILLAVIGGVIGYFVPEISETFRSGSSARGAGSPEYRKLLRMTMGDREQAERLIRYERRYAPGADREQLIRRAIDRLEYDRRR